MSLFICYDICILAWVLVFNGGKLDDCGCGIGSEFFRFLEMNLWWDYY